MYTSSEILEWVDLKEVSSIGVASSSTCHLLWIFLIIRCPNIAVGPLELKRIEQKKYFDLLFHIFTRLYFYKLLRAFH